VKLPQPSNSNGNNHTDDTKPTTVASEEAVPTQSSLDKPHLVICAKTEEHLLPIAKYFTIHRLIDGFNGVPPWNATTLLLVDNPWCADDPYVKESIRRRLESPFVDPSAHENELNGEWKLGVYFPKIATKMKQFMRTLQDRPALMRANGEVFWRNNGFKCNDVDFVWDRQTENPSDDCFTVHYLQGVSGSYNRANEGELGPDETTAIYEGKRIHPQRPPGNALNYSNFCSFLIRSDPDDLTKMFRDKNYDIDAIVRHMFFKQLSEYKPCERVYDCPGNPYTSYECFAGYKFHITMENSLVDGYVSEKLFNGALGGGIPIYFGAPDISSYVNGKSILHCNVSRSVIEVMRSFFPRASKEKRIFLLHDNRTWPSEQELLKWADGYLRKELEPCVQRVVELDGNETAYKEVISQPFITNQDIMNGMYPLRGINAVLRALQSWPSLNKDTQKAAQQLFQQNHQADEDKALQDVAKQSSIVIVDRDINTTNHHNLPAGQKWCPWTDSDQIVNSPCDLQLLLRHLISRVPFSYAHFNDGEIAALQREVGKTDRGMQALSPRLKQTMHHAFHQNYSGLIYGLPCRMQFKSAYDFATKNLENSTNVKKTQATLFIDANYKIARNVLLTYLQTNRGNRSLHLVVGDAADMDLFRKMTGLGNGTINVIYVPNEDAFPKGYDDNIDKWKEFGPDDIVIICAGPLGRIFAVEWFLLANSTTFLELGSFFDLDLYGKSFGASYYDSRKQFGSCNDSSERSWQIQEDRLLRLATGTS
jgi:hypothetical protein